MGPIWAHPGGPGAQSPKPPYQQEAKNLTFTIKLIPGLDIPVPCSPTPISLFSAPLPCFCTVFLLPHPAYNSNDLFGLFILVFVCLNQQSFAPVTPHGLVMMRPFSESWEFPVLKVQIVCTNDRCYSIVIIIDVVQIDQF